MGTWGRTGEVEGHSFLTAKHPKVHPRGNGCIRYTHAVEEKTAVNEQGPQPRTPPKYMSQHCRSQKNTHSKKPLM